MAGVIFSMPTLKPRTQPFRKVSTTEAFLTGAAAATAVFSLISDYSFPARFLDRKKRIRRTTLAPISLQKNSMTMTAPRLTGQMASSGAPPVMVLLMQAEPAYW